MSAYSCLLLTNLMVVSLFFLVVNILQDYVKHLQHTTRVLAPEYLEEIRGEGGSLPRFIVATGELTRPHFNISSKFVTNNDTNC